MLLKWNGSDQNWEGVGGRERLLRPTMRDKDFFELFYGSQARKNPPLWWRPESINLLALCAEVENIYYLSFTGLAPYRERGGGLKYRSFFQSQNFRRKTYFFGKNLADIRVTFSCRHYHEKKTYIFIQAKKNICVFSTRPCLNFSFKFRRS